MRSLFALIPLAGFFLMVIGGFGRYRVAREYERLMGKTDYITFMKNIETSQYGKEFLVYQWMVNLGTVSFFSYFLLKFHGA